MIIDKIALALLIIGGCLRRIGQHDQPDHLYHRGPVRRVVHLSAVPGYVGQEKLTRGRGGTFLLEGRLGSRIPAVLFYMS